MLKRTSRMHDRQLLALLIPLALAAGGCATQCTLIACAEQVEIRFDENRELPADLKVDVELADGTIVECTTSASKHTCSDKAVDWLIRSEESSNDKASTLEAGGKLSGVRISGKHSTVKLRVSSGSDVVVEGTVKPKYVESEINGPGCGTCSVASEKI